MHSKVYLMLVMSANIHRDTWDISQWAQKSEHLLKERTADCLSRQAYYSTVLLMQCCLRTQGSHIVRQWFPPLASTHRDFHGVLESFHNMMFGRWWKGKTLQSWVEKISAWTVWKISFTKICRNGESRLIFASGLSFWSVLLLDPITIPSSVN